MGKIFTRKQFSNYLGEQRAILDVDTSFFLDPSPTPTSTPTASQISPTPTPTPSAQYDYYEAENCCYPFDTQTFKVLQGTIINQDGGFLTAMPEGYVVIGNGSAPETKTWNVIVDNVCSVLGACPSPTPTPTPTITPTPSPIPLFNIGSGFDATSQTIFIDSSDNIFVGGTFYGYDGTLSQGGLVKLDTNGNIDTTFNSGVVSSLPGIGGIFGISEDETGDYIYIVGSFTQTTPTIVQRVAKVDKNTGLSVWPSIACNGNILDISVDPSNGDVYVVGAFTSISGVSRNRIAKFDSSGVLDTGVFTNGLNSSGNSCIINRNGNLVVTGAFTTYSGLSANRLIEIELSTYTNTGFWGTGADQSNQKVFQRQDNGEYIFVGNGGTINGVSIGKVAKFLENGTNIPFTTALGGIVPAGLYLDEINDYIYISNSQSVAGIRRYEYGTGNTDTTFENNIGTFVAVPSYSNSGSCQVISLDSNNRIYLVGSFSFLNGNQRNRIVRFLQNGIDNTTI